MSWSSAPLFSVVAKDLAGDDVTTSAEDSTGCDFIVAFCRWNIVFSTPSAFSDSEGNTWQKLTEYTYFVNTKAAFYYCVNPTTDASHTFTLTGYDVVVQVTGWTGSHATPFDVENGSGGDMFPGTTWQPGLITPTVNDELVLCGISGTNTSSTAYTINGGFTIELNDTSSYSAFAYLVQTAAVAANPTWTNTAQPGVASGIVSFKTIGGGATTTLSRMACLGVR